MPAGTVYVVDDHEAIRDSLALLLRSAGFAVRSFASPFDFLADYRPRELDCLVRDVRLGGVAALSEREREVLARILDGDTNREVAKGLGVTSKAIEYHRARVMRKLGVRSAAELFRFCLDA